MVRRKVRRSGILLALFTACPSAVAAEAVSIWYRAGDGCPNAAAFLERLTPHPVVATIARAGDRIDFVVTLDRDERGSTGSLERQSSGGTVAIRQVEAASCDAVADALALTLVLSADPDAATGARTKAASTGPVSPPATAEETPPMAKPVRAATPTATSLAIPPRAAVNQPSPFRPSFGAHASIGTFAESSTLLGASAFVDLALERGPRPSARARFVAGFAAPGETLNLQLLLGRLEACPVTIGSDLSLVPCVALDLGALRAENEEVGGHTDTGLWSAAWALGRLAYAPSLLWALELEGGVSVPFAHYELTASDQRRILAETKRVTLGLSAGVRLAWP
jgi:hypothetical protein